MGIIANGELLDTLRRVKCFGVPLVRIDVRLVQGRSKTSTTRLPYTAYCAD
ncbi:hypothetical protein PUR50_33380 [Enterobacter hormaechei subsp. steigerwaltii]|nr:hypothetical protein [Enterobacter hormaechei subsp. steigerwaltii]